ncbi:unnamed protein product [Nippostrongylus brasiliensis]|uniref:DNA-directed RNA polymerase III subunit RPC3 n=1 Tax=Nippostrongylus brasiliensis TaxID=27835 RepID=A0A0N4YF39_NIPBR|nr:unnamed protein product [Nippostrongylus brasiliensis]
MTKGESPGTDGITFEMLLACEEKLFSALVQRFTRYVTKCQVQTAKRSITILLFKKGDKEDLVNYRPITLLPVLYNMFTRCVLSRMKMTLDEEHLVEQEGRVIEVLENTASHWYNTDIHRLPRSIRLCGAS